MEITGLHMMTSGVQVLLAVCFVMIIVGCFKGRAILNSLSSCGMDGCELKRLYSEFKNDVERLRVEQSGEEFLFYRSLDQSTIDFMLDQSPPEDYHLLH